MKTKVKLISSIVSADFIEASDVMIRLPAHDDHAMLLIFKPAKNSTGIF
jgi:hypothetical protein